jgi:hypothetical protein
MITNSLEIYNFDKDGNKTHRISLIKKDRYCDIVFCVQKIEYNENYDEIVVSTIEFDIHWHRMFLFIKSCLASHIK